MPLPSKRELQDDLNCGGETLVSCSEGIDEYYQLVHDTTASVELAARLQWEIDRDGRQSPAGVTSPTKISSLAAPPEQQLEQCREILKEAAKRVSLVLQFPKKKSKARRIESSADGLGGLRILQCIQIGLVTK